MLFYQPYFNPDYSINEQFEKNFSQNQMNNLENESISDALSSNSNYDNIGLVSDFNLNQGPELFKDQEIKEENDNQIQISTKNTLPKKQNKLTDKKADNIIKKRHKDKKDKKIRGRKRKSEKREASHTKYRSDNEMRKVKTYIMKFIFDYLNKSIIYNRKKFLKINKKLNENLGIDYNKSLMQMTIKEIFEQNTINSRYNKFNRDRKLNQELIKEIFEKNEDIETIKILNMKYIDLVIIYRSNYLNQFISDLTKKEIKDGEDKENIESYVKDLKYLLLNYEYWFKNKVGRVKSYN